MYGKIGCVAGSGVAGCGTLACTGLDALAGVVAGSTLVFAGLALLKLVPRHPPR